MGGVYMPDKAKNNTRPGGYVILLYCLSAALLLFTIAVAISAYLSGSALIADPVLREGLSAYFEKPARSITEEDLASVKAVQIDENTVSFAGADVLTGLKKNYALDITESASIVPVDMLYHTVEYTSPVTDFSVLSVFPHLEYLSVYDSPALRDSGQLSAFCDLYELEIWDADFSARLSDFDGMPGLTVLTLSCADITDTASLASHPALERLYLSDGKLSDLSALSGLEKLKVLSLTKNRIADAGALSGLGRLQYLDLSENLLTDVSPLKGLTSLKELYLKGNENIGDLSPLSSLSSAVIDIRE